MLVFIVEITNIKMYSRKTNQLWNIYTIWTGARNIYTKKLKINNFKIEIVSFVVTIPFAMDKSRFKKRF